MSKETLINFKIETEVKAVFLKLCKENFTNPSHELRLLVRQYIKKHKTKSKK